jgi:hypothetical protein
MTSTNTNQPCNQPDLAGTLIVLLSRFREHLPAIATSALQETLSTEPCRENLRAIGSVLSNADPLTV